MPISYRLVCLIQLLLLAGCAGNQPTSEGVRAQAAAEANTQLGIEYLRSGDLDKSRNRLEKAIRLAPDYPVAHDAIAVLYEQVGDFELAEKHYRKSLSLEPEHAGTHNNYGQFLCKTRRYDEAVETFERAAANPYYRTPWVPLTNAGVCLMGVPDNGRAEDYLRRALKRQPKYAPALLNMADISFGSGNYLSSRGYLQRYQQVADHTAASLWLAIRTEYELGDHQTWGNYALMLRNGFPDSEQYLLLQEWENERRAGN